MYQIWDFEGVQLPAIMAHSISIVIGLLELLKIKEERKGRV